MSSDGSEVWSTESRKTDEQVEQEIIAQAQRKVKSRLSFPSIPQSTNFNIDLKHAIMAQFKKGEIVWFSMDGSNWPCVVLASFAGESKNRVGAQTLNNTVKAIGKSKKIPINKVNSIQKKDKIWKIWPGASVFKRNMFGRKLLKYMKKIVSDDSDQSQESFQDSSDAETLDDVERIKLNYKNQYDLIPLPLSINVLQDLEEFKMENLESKMDKVDGDNIKPWLHKDIFPISSDDVNRNLGLLQAIHTSCSWAISKDHLNKLKEMEANSLSSFINISIEYYRHGTEIIAVGDLVRLITNLRQTRNVISNQTTQVLYVASLNLVSQLSTYQDSKDTFWDHEILLHGLVYEPRGSDCVSTGEYRTVTTGGICGRWYSSFLNINRKMPVIEESSWVL
jgi:hypothetical protein